MDILGRGNVSMEGLIPYETYYRSSGIRRPVQLVAPPMLPLTKLDLPLGAILHFVSDDETLYGLPQDDALLKTFNRAIQVEHVVDLGDTQGSPRRTTVVPGQLIRDYHRKNARLRWLRDISTVVKDPRIPLMINYAVLPHLFRYVVSYFRGYYKWLNIQSAVWKKVGEISRMSDRQQFIVCHIPKIIPSRTMLEQGQKGMNRLLLTRFQEPESLFILELWKWLGEFRKDSVLSKAGNGGLKNVNLLWMESGKWFTLNLGLLDEWRIDPLSEKGEGTLSADVLQKRFLRLMMFLQSARAETEGALTHDLAPVNQTTVIQSVQGVDTNAEEKAVDMATVTVTPVKISVTTGSDDRPDSNRQEKFTLKPNLDVTRLTSKLLEETPENIKTIDDVITKDLEVLEMLHQQLRDIEVKEEQEIAEQPDKIRVDYDHKPVEYRPEVVPLEQFVMRKADQLADAGALSAAEYRRVTALSTAYRRLPNPYNPDQTIAEGIVIKPSELSIDNDKPVKEILGVTDKSMLKSSLETFDAKYVEQVMPKDIMRMVVGLQKSGTAVTGYQVLEIEDAMSFYESHSVQFTPAQGKASTVHFRVPKVQADGTYKSNGVRYRMRKQRGDMPIRKVAYNKVALTSYYAKILVTRCERQSYNYSNWLTNQIAAMGMNSEDTQVTNMMLANVFDSTIHVPRLYSILSQRFRNFNIGNVEYLFDYHAREEHFGKEEVKAAELNGAVVVGRNYPVLRGRKQNTLRVLDPNNILYDIIDDKLELVGPIESLLNLRGRPPVEMAEVKVFNKQIPVGIFLAYQLGLTQLLKLVAKNNYRRIQTGERMNLADDEFAVRFEDETLIFTRDDPMATMIFAGFTQFEDSIRNYPISLFDNKDIYFNLLMQNHLGVRYLREMDLLTDLFVDPITEDILKEMGDPTDFVGLLFRACELLITDWSPHETDMQYMRIKGYERISGAVYGEMVKAIRVQRARGSAGAGRIEMAPFQIWQSIQQDPAVKTVEDSNPIHNLKEKEEVTYSGVGGRSARSMVERTRVFHANDVGVISEATKDSGDVAITTFLTSSPNLINLRGMTKNWEESDGAAALLSTSALISPSSDRDEARRVNFVSIQHSSGTFANGYRAMPLRTGFERVLAQRVDDLFAVTAKQKGQVVEKDDRAIKVKYEDGSEKSFELGRRFGTVSGMTLPHELEAALNLNDTFDVGDAIAFNSRYFQKDSLNPREVVWKWGAMARTALLESTDTLEDSSALSQELANRLVTEVTKVRDVIVEFDQAVHNLVAIGSEVGVESILCTIEDPVTAQNKLFDDTSLDTLRILSANNPKSKMSGRVEKIEVFYHGDIDDLSPSLAEIAHTSDRNRRRDARRLGTTYTSGQVDDSLRIMGNALPYQNVVVRIYITGPVHAATGDKFVFANQLKTIVGRIMTGQNKSEDGRDIDAIFGMESVSARIVWNPFITGTTSTIMKLVSLRAVAAYRGNLK